MGKETTPLNIVIPTNKCASNENRKASLDKHNKNCKQDLPTDTKI